jgi:hypothetical protein
MMLRCSIPAFLILLFALCTISLRAQDSLKPALDRSVWRSDWALGFMAHTNGFGTYFRGERYRGAFIKEFYHLELTNLKHPKEQKSFNPAGAENGSFIYGKIHSVFVLKAMVGRERTMFDKEVIRGVRISRLLAAGLNIGILKPYYVQVASREDSRSIIEEPYNPYKHSYDDIVDKGNFTRGFARADVLPGLSLKTALNFEFSPDDTKLKAIEVGFNLDGFLKPVHIMAHNTATQLYLTAYLSFHFGQKTFL